MCWVQAASNFPLLDRPRAGGWTQKWPITVALHVLSTELMCEELAKLSLSRAQLHLVNNTQNVDLAREASMLDAHI